MTTQPQVRTKDVVSLCKASLRMPATLAWQRARRSPALSRLREPLAWGSSRGSVGEGVPGRTAKVLARQQAYRH